MQSTSLFSKNIIFPQLKEEEKIKCDEELSEREISSALKTMKNGSSPGPDGIPVEFYKMFWKDLKKLYIEAMKYNQTIGKLSPTQRQGTISLIHKGKELSKDTLTNWRPISLTNADYKYFSKALALRLSAVLSNIINENQAGFIKGRKISELIREIDDIDLEKSNPQSQSYTLSIDYSKAFDTISIVTIIEALRMFNFGENLISWIKALLTERTANVKNGGSLSESFPLERGVRQGCPVSPLLFIIAVEILALNVCQDEKILGIQLPNATKSLKILQYADDTTLFLRNITDLKEVLEKIKQFSIVSGLKLNEDKSKILKMNKQQMQISHLENIKIVEKMKVLGIVFSSETSAGEPRSLGYGVVVLCSYHEILDMPVMSLESRAVSTHAKPHIALLRTMKQR
ncbi:reverse transcriptase [Elysia marginata]|uniref:Reverse transcriptase n=1 Tax=Elysia marginata TaxID=1093978 RepID=A0AAV4HAF7_9GAST|nr:reverse transcriptase [Elysia marginata]